MNPAEAEDAVRQFLLEDAALVAFVGERILPMPFDQAGTVPAITYRRVTTRRDQTLTGPSGLEWARTQYDVWAKNEPEPEKPTARSVFRAMKLAVDGKAFTRQAVNVMRVEVGTDQDLYDDAVRLHRVSVEIVIGYGKAA